MQSGYQALAALYKSAAYKAVYFSPQHPCWILAKGNVTLRGVRRSLQDRAWPSYDYERAERLNDSNASRRVTTGMRGRGHGSRRGSVVHTQLQMIAAHGLAAAQRILAARREPMEPLVLLLLQNFKDQNIKLVASELPVYAVDDFHRLGSSIDLVCARKSDGALIFIELKVGGDNYYNKSNDYMENELQACRVPNSPLNQAMMQLMAYKILFERCYGNIVKPQHMAAWMVVFVGPSGVLYRKLEAQQEQHLREPLARLLQAANPPKNSAPSRKKPAKK